ncbi:MAG: DNA double-strand break repair nuclease NurA [Candidatus Altiarchaeota archaeon]|nr:DNA double-strand break repair nuclease NurA [Candidatus Altiarchaeota archaeon]
MKPVKPFFDVDYSLIEDMFHTVDLASGRDLEKDSLRSLLSSHGCEVKEVKTKPEISGELGIICGDSSNAVRELRYHALWGVHSTCVYGVFDGREYPDTLSGHGKIIYRDLLYSSDIKFGSIVPYSEVDSRANSMRVQSELSFLTKCVEEVSVEGKSVDYVLLDGSILTNLQNLRKKGEDFPETQKALKALKDLMKRENLVGMAEDSHATDLSRELGFDYTNMLLFDVALDPMEYVVDERDGVYVCYVKLPAKKLTHTPSGVGAPMTVRWEFNKKGFEDDLNKLAFLWTLEDDLLHPQLYPLRLADYFTRQVKIGGILDAIVQERKLDLKYRELREA